MSAYILILIFSVGGSYSRPVAAVSAEFSSYAACNAAYQKLAADVTQLGTTVFIGGGCFKKGDK